MSSATGMKRRRKNRADGRMKTEKEYCENERPPRDVICQKQKGHSGRHFAVIYWEEGGVEK